MNYLKILGFAALTIAAMTVLVGAGTASATVLCKTSGGTTCPAGQAYGSGTAIHAVNVGTVVTTTVYKNIECKKSTMAGATSSEGSPTETVRAALSVLTFEECNCDVVVLKKGTLEIHWISGTNNGTVTYSGEEKTVTCSTIFGSVHCIYVTNADIGTLSGGSPAVLNIPSASVNFVITNALCEEDRYWDAKYEITSPNPLYVTDHT